jgi:beta-phosphoglucomutase-like phosphatase (HAD superfamily)
MNLFPKAVIFDMDGTLVDSIPYHKKAWLAFLRNHEIHLDEESFHAQNHGTIEEMMFRFFGPTLINTLLIDFSEEKERTFREMYRPQIKEVDGLTDYLESIFLQKVRIGLATMGDQNNIDFTLDSLGIRRFFHSTTGGHEVGKGKPDPEIYELALTKVGMKAKDCLAFEDSIGGVKSAISTGIEVIGITTTHTREELLDFGCIQAVESFRELLAKS